MDFRDFGQIDFKNIDVSYFLKKILQRQDILFCIVISIATLFAAGKILSSQRSKIESLKSKIGLLEEKNEAIEAFEKEKKTLDSFVETLPQGTVELNNIINAISEIAILRDVQIVSVTPQGRDSTAFYDSIMLQINVSVDDYTKLVLFVNDIENSNYNLRIDNWSVNMRTRRGRRHATKHSSSENDKQNLDVNMKIASISFKSHEK